MATKKTTAPRAEYAAKSVTPLMNEFCDWIEREVGVKLDADARRAVYLGSALRTTFQAANRSAKQPSEAVPATKRSPKQTPSKVAESKPASRKRGSTIATPEGVVIAEQRHIEVA
jgi:hypothetical protein